MFICASIEVHWFLSNQTGQNGLKPDGTGHFEIVRTVVLLFVLVNRYFVVVVRPEGRLSLIILVSKCRVAATASGLSMKRPASSLLYYLSSFAKWVHPMQVHVQDRPECCSYLTQGNPALKTTPKDSSYSNELWDCVEVEKLSNCQFSTLW